MITASDCWPGALATALFALTPLLASAPPAMAAACPTVEAIAVPGTTQTHPRADPKTPVGVLGKILEPLRKHAPVKLTTYYTPYPATIVGGGENGGYKASKEAGIDATNARLKAVATRCPSTVFLLTGYSQGADVAGDLAATIGHNRGIIPASRLLGVALVADPSQAPTGQPTIGPKRPGIGFAGVRSGGFGSLTQRNGLLSICAPQDYYCNLPQGDVVMRLIGHLGSQLDPADPAGSAKKLATIFMAGLVAPATAAINQIITLVSDPNLIPNLIQRGTSFAKALAQQLFWLGGPQVAATATALVNAATNVINLVSARAWTALPATITALAGRANDVGKALSQMAAKTSTINVDGFGPVGAGLSAPSADIDSLATAVLNAISIATGGIATQATGIFGPTFSRFSPATVASSLTRYAEFIRGGFHSNYHTTALDEAGHTGTEIVRRYLANQINKLL
ncbi:MAG: cutinase family protein [Actinomycetia bacterium]|nr:cutinase family protein [Actinomycetes bacterium]